MEEKVGISQDLLEKAVGSDIEAFEKIYKKTSPFVYNLALQIVHSKEEAEEVTQDVFLKVYRNFKKFRFRSSFSTWLYKIAINTAINKNRSRIKDRQNIEYKDGLSPLSFEEKLNGTLERMDREELVSELLKLLDEKQRFCIILREKEGLSYKEIAEILKVPINTVRTRIKRAREKLLKYRNKELVKNEL